LVPARCRHFVALSSLAALACDGSEEPSVNPGCTSQAIYGGVESAALVRLPPSQYSAIGIVQSVQSSENAFCTGTVIAADWVLTAAHCNVAPMLRFRSPQANPQLMQGLEVVDVAIHPSLDLALLRVPNVGQWTAAIPIVQDDAQMRVGDSVQLAGLGKAEDRSRGRRLFAVEPIRQTTAEYLEVNGSGRSGMCFGDSGGPLLTRDTTGTVVVIGVLSFGEDTCTGLDVAVRTAPVVDWIESVIQELDDPPSDACENVGATGFCDGGRAVYCTADTLRVDSCAANDVCGWHEGDGFRCIAPADDPCSGIGSQGQCQDGRALNCNAGELDEQRCGCECARSASDGRAVCF
jgi:hypothetical protein